MSIIKSTFVACMARNAQGTLKKMKGIKADYDFGSKSVSIN